MVCDINRWGHEENGWDFEDSILKYFMLNWYRIMHKLKWRNVMHSQEKYFGVDFPSCEATEEINTTITLKWVHKHSVERVHTLFYFLHDIMNPYMTIKMMIFTHWPHVSLVRFIFCWWCHTDLKIVMKMMKFMNNGSSNEFQWPHLKA